MVSDNLRAPCELLMWKCGQDGKTTSHFATDHIDVAVAYPHVGVQTVSIVLGRAVIKHRRDPSPPQHQLRGQDLLKTQPTPWHSRRGGCNRPPNSLHRIRACMARKRSIIGREAKSPMIRKGNTAMAILANANQQIASARRKRSCQDRRTFCKRSSA